MSSAAIEDAVRAIALDPGQLSSRATAISKDLIEQRTDITGLIESLGFALTAAEVEQRRSATQLLSAVLDALPGETLNAVQLQFIVTFYCDRLRDHHSVVPAVLVGIRAIIRMRAFPAACTAVVLQALFQNVSCQSQVRDDRQRIFEILRVLCESQRDELLNMGSDFVYGVISAIDGERDPRILMRIFEFVPQFVRTYPLGHLTEEMFEVCACYFPVDFNPSPDDQERITRDGLARQLAACLVAHGAFAEFCVPLLLEKLDSQLAVAKLDALDVLRLAGERFAPDYLDAEFPSVWIALHAEIVAVDRASGETAASALRALEALVRGTAVAEDAQHVRNILVTVFETIIGPLSNALSVHFELSAGIALVCARASRRSAVYVTNKLLPLLLTESDAHEANAAKTASIYEHISRTLECCVRFDAIDEVDADALRTFHGRLIEGARSNSPALAQACLRCLAQIVRSLDATARRTLYAHINGTLLAAGAESPTNALLVALAGHCADEVKTEVLDRWLNAAELPGANAAHIVDTVAGLVRIAAFTQPALEFLCRHIFQRDDAAVRCLALASLQQVVLGLEQAHFDEFYGDSGILALLIAQATNAAHSSETLCKLSGCIRAVIRRLSVDEQSAIVERHLADLDLRRVADVYVAVGLLAFASADVRIAADTLASLLGGLGAVCAGPADEATVDMSLRALCSLANKASDRADTNAIVVAQLDRLTGAVRDQRCERSLRVLAWLAKGLILRGHPDGFAAVEFLLEQIEDDSELSEALLVAFDVITLDVPTLHLPVVRFLHRQKLLETILQRTASNETNERKLRAVAFVLRATPLAAITINLQRIAPLLFRGLGLPQPEAVRIFIGIIDGLIGRANELILGHLNRLIPLYLQLSTYKDSMHIRIAALNGIVSIAKYPPVHLQPYKADVCYGLAAALDDPKRLVRQAAANTRNRWFLL